MTLDEAIQSYPHHMSAARRMLSWLISDTAIIAELQTGSPVRAPLSPVAAADLTRHARTLYARPLDAPDSAALRSQVMAAASESMRVIDEARTHVDSCAYWARIIADPASDEDSVRDATRRTAALLAIARGHTAIAGGIRTTARDGAVAVVPKGVRTDDRPPTADAIHSAVMSALR